MHARTGGPRRVRSPMSPQYAGFEVVRLRRAASGGNSCFVLVVVPRVLAGRRGPRLSHVVEDLLVVVAQSSKSMGIMSLQWVSRWRGERTGPRGLYSASVPSRTVRVRAVAVPELDRVLADEAVAAEDLKALVGDLHRSARPRRRRGEERRRGSHPRDPARGWLAAFQVRWRMQPHVSICMSDEDERDRLLLGDRLARMRGGPSHTGIAYSITAARQADQQRRVRGAARSRVEDARGRRMPASPPSRASAGHLDLVELERDGREAPSCRG